MRAFVIEPEAGNDPALVGERLRQHGFELTDVVLSDEQGDALDITLPEPSAYDVVAVRRDKPFKYSGISPSSLVSRLNQL